MHSKVIEITCALKDLQKYQCVPKNCISYNYLRDGIWDVWEYKYEYENGIWIWNIYVFSSCLNTTLGKWRNEMGGQVLKPLTVLTLLTINTTNNYCRWLSCIVGGCAMYMVILKGTNMRTIYEKYGEICMKIIFGKNEKRNYICLSLQESYIYIWVQLLTQFCMAKVFTYKILSLLTGYSLCHQKKERIQF